MAKEIYVKPGEVLFGNGAVVKTLLGSCVSILVWHPAKRVGGMCHFVLPARGSRTGGGPDGRFAPEAMELLVRGMALYGTTPAEYRFQLYGGGNMFPEFNIVSGQRVGNQNAAAARSLVRQYSGQLEVEELGRDVYRHIAFDLDTGEVAARATPVAHGIWPDGR
jgi:chemotaxis protein CheD